MRAWTDSEWHACASFAVVKRDLGLALTTLELEALERFPSPTSPPTVARSDGRPFSFWLAPKVAP